MLKTIRNPDYGRGLYRRRIRLFAEAGAVQAALEDTNHAMRLVLRHDGARIVEIRPEFRRYPLTVCPGAAAPLQAFIGTALATPLRRLLSEHDPRAHCTHIYDLTVLGIAQALRGGARQYDVEIPDEHPGPVWSRVLRDGEEVHRWQTFEARIVAPGPLAGRPLLKGFTLWAIERFAGDAEALEAAMVFQKGYLVGYSRRYDPDAYAGQRADEHAPMRGKCHAYSEPAVFEGVSLAGMSRDLTDVGEELLADFRPGQPRGR